MATENPVRLVGRSSAGKWPSSRNADDFTFKSMKVEEFGLLMKDHKIHENQEDMVPNRSGSAPPSMEGSFAAVTNIMVQPSSVFCRSMANFSSSLGDYESEKQSCADPAYFAYYCSNVNLNPRLPPPLISREKRRLAQHIGGFGNKLRLASFDDNANKPLNIFQLSLSTHKEELEDDRLLQKENDYWAGSNTGLSSLDSPSLLGFHENLVDLTQGNFPLLPSTVISQSHSFTNTTEDESVDHDILATMLNDPFLDVSKPDDPTPDSTEVCVGADVIALDSSDDPSPASSQGLSYYDGTGSSQSSQSDELINKGSNLANSREMDFSRLESGMRALNVSTHPVGDDERNRQEQWHYDRHMSQQGTGAPCQGWRVQPQIFSDGLNRSYSGTDKTSHVLPKLSSTGAQQALHSQGPTPPFYTAATAYTSGGSPLYHNLQAPSLFSPQFNMSGGYAYGSAIFAPYLTGYPPQNAMPVPLDISSGQNFNGQAFGISTGDGIPNGVDLQHLNKIYEHGIMLQSSLMDPVHMQYFLPSEVAYGAPGSYGQFAPICDIGGQMDCFTLQKDALHENDHYFQPPSNGSVSSPSPRKEAAVASDYLLSSPNVGVVAQFPFLPLGCPMLLGSTVCGTNDPEQRVRFSQGSVPEISYGWQEQKRRESFNDQKKHYFLEELKANNARKFELSDVAGRIAEFSVDQHGSRFIQQKLEHWSPEEKESVFKEVLPHASKLMTDVFGNYVIQKFFEHGSHEQRKELANQLSGHMLSLSLQMYGCRVIQKAFEVIELDQKTQLVQELEGYVMKCVHDQNGNHVIQKCIECVPTKKIGFIIDAFRGHVSELSTHPYGCRVIQRVLEHCSDELQCCCVVDEILESACVLAQDQYGNYVIQHVLDRGKPHERSRIISKLSGCIVQMSQHKYASNVVERCLEHGDATERELLIREITGQSEENDNLLIMMKDQFANYVVQKILEISNDKQREMLIKRVRLHLNALKKYTYGKHIVARFEKVYGGETED